MKKRKIFNVLFVFSLVMFFTIQISATSLNEVSTKTTTVFPDGELIDVGFDYGDYTDSYIKIATNSYSMSDRQQTHMAVGLGYDVPDSDAPSDQVGTLGWTDGVSDDMNSSYLNAGSTDYKDNLYGDDETGIGAKVVNEDNNLQFYNNMNSQIAIDVPYDYFTQLDEKIPDSDGVAKIAIWIDFDGNGSYDEDEYFANEVNSYDFDENLFPNAGPSFIAEQSSTFTIPIPKNAVEQTTMHMVMSTDQDSITKSSGNDQEYSGYGEIEDYGVEFLNADTVETCIPPLYLNYNRFYSEDKPTVEKNGDKSSLTFTNIDVPAFDAKIDIKIESEYLTTDNGSGYLKYPNVISETEYGWPIVYNYSITGSAGAKTMKIETTITDSETGELFPIQLMNTFYDLDGADEAQRVNQGDYFDYDSFRTEYDSQIELTPNNFILNTDDVVEAGIVDQSSTQSASINTTRSAYFRNVYWTSSAGKGGYTELNYPSVVTEYNPCIQEHLQKDVIEPSDGIVNNGETVEYELTIDSLKNMKNEIQFIDELDSQYLTYDSIDEAKFIIEDSNGDFIDYSLENNSSTDSGLDVTLTGEFPVGSTISVIFYVNVDNAPENVTIDNFAVAYVDGLETNEDDATVSTGDLTNPNDGDIVSFKYVNDESANGKIEESENVTYKIVVHNTSDEDVDNVNVSDDIFAQLSDYFDITGDEELTIESEDNNEIATVPDSTTSNLDVSDLSDINGITFETINSRDEITIEFTLKSKDMLPDSEDVLNVASVTDPDNGTHYPGVEIPTNGTPDTVILKTVSDENGDGMLSVGETVNYTILVENISMVEAKDVAIKDSIFQDMPSYIKYNNDLSVSSGCTTQGDMAMGDYKIDSIMPGETISLSYSLTLNERVSSDEASTLVNIATDNGEEPVNMCDKDNNEVDCSNTETRISPETFIEKTVIDENNNQIAEENEVITYNIKVSNKDAEMDAVDVIVRDSMLENIPSYITFNDDLVVSGANYSGNLQDGDLVLDKVAPESDVTLTYSVTLTSINNDIDSLINIATDDGSTPGSICEEEGINCSEAEISIDVAEEGSENSEISEPEIKDTGKSYYFNIFAILILTILTLISLRKVYMSK